MKSVEDLVLSWLIYVCDESNPITVYDNYVEALDHMKNMLRDEWVCFYFMILSEYIQDAFNDATWISFASMSAICSVIRLILMFELVKMVITKITRFWANHYGNCIICGASETSAQIIYTNLWLAHVAAYRKKN